MVKLFARLLKKFKREEADTVHCPACWAENAVAYLFCRDCGHQLVENPIDKMKEPLVVIQTEQELKPVSQKELEPESPGEARESRNDDFEEKTVMRMMPVEEPAEESKPQESENLSDQNTNGESENFQTISEGQVCMNCGLLVPAQNSFCGSCGTKYGKHSPEAFNWSETMFCRTVGKENQVHGDRLVTINMDGTEGEIYPLKSDLTLLGKGEGDIDFKGNDYISSKHARFYNLDGKLMVQDLGSKNGIFKQLKGKIQIQPGDYIRIGQELLRFSDYREIFTKDDFFQDEAGTKLWGSKHSGSKWRLVQVFDNATIGNIYFLNNKDENLVGRTSGNITFAHDSYISARHAIIYFTEEKWFLQDLDSTNGTFLRIIKEVVLNHSDFILIGEIMFRVDRELGA